MRRDSSGIRRSRRALTLTVVAALVSPLLVASASRADWLFPSGTPVASARTGYPVVTVPDRGGGVLVAFEGLPVPGGPAIRVQHVTASGDIAPGWPAEGAVACSLAMLAPNGELRGVSDGAGGAFFLWIEGSVPLPFGEGPAYVQHVLASGVRDPGWPGRGRLLANGGSQVHLRALQDGSGGVLAVWRDLRSGVEAIRAARVTLEGLNALGFPPDGLILSTELPSASMVNPELAPDGTSGYWLTYAALSVDTTSTPSSYRVVHLTPTGHVDPDWLGNGVALPSMSSAQVAASSGVAADGAGGAYVLAMAGEEARLHHVRADRTFDPGWPGSGLALGDGRALDVFQYGLSYRLARDERGGIYAGWVGRERSRSDTTLATARARERRVRSRVAYGGGGRRWREHDADRRRGRRVRVRDLSHALQRLVHV